MKKTSTVLLATVAGVCAMLVLDRLHAQPEPATPKAVPKAAPTRVGVCDVVAILTKYKRVHDVRKQFEARQVEIKAQQKAKGKEIDNELKFLRDEFKPGTPDYEKQLAKIREKTIQMKVWEDVQAEVNRRNQYMATRALQQEVLAEVRSEAKLRSIDIVLHNPLTPEPPASGRAPDPLRIHALLYASKETDLTDIVLKKLNDKYEKNPGK